jgi:hypothetical protein
VTLDEAADSIGKTVVYFPYGGGRPQVGEITEVRSRWVFVRYVNDGETAKATMPQDLRLFVGEVAR